MFPGRDANAAKHRNPDYTICRAAGQRILRCALIHLVTEERKFKDAAMRQLQALFDTNVWPEWIDQSHKRFGHPADLRTGMLGLDVAIAYDWLSPALSQNEKRFCYCRTRYAGHSTFFSLRWRRTHGGVTI